MENGAPAAPRIDSRHHDAVIFDMDGVVTDSASIHAAAWAELFDDFLTRRAAGAGQDRSPFTESDYLRFVDGKPRYRGVEDFLAARGITLPWGNAAGIRTGVFSASRHCVEVLTAARITDLFTVRVDGVDAEELGLPGKPDPAMLFEAARRLDAEPDRTVVVEDAEAGVAAGRRGGFALVIGVDRHANADRLLTSGADVVLDDLVRVRLRGGFRRMPEVPDVVECCSRIEDLLSTEKAAVLLDFDGTLADIVAAARPSRLRAARRDDPPHDRLLPGAHLPRFDTERAGAFLGAGPRQPRSRRGILRSRARVRRRRHPRAAPPRRGFTSPRWQAASICCSAASPGWRSAAIG